MKKKYYTVIDKQPEGSQDGQYGGDFLMPLLPHKVEIMDPILMGPPFGHPMIGGPMIGGPMIGGPMIGPPITKLSPVFGPPGTGIGFMPAIPGIEPRIEKNI